MLRKLLCEVGLIGLAAGMLGGHPAEAQTISSGSYYAIPSWDQTLSASTRFIVLSNFGNAAVLDRETGLVWEQSPAAQLTVWQDAVDHCITLDAGGRRGWRLPTIQELASVLASSGDPLPAGHPFNILAAYYWSATTAINDADSAWISNLSSDPFITDKLLKTAKEFAFLNGIPILPWCVRGGQGVNTP